MARVTSRAVRGSAEIAIQFAPNTDMELALQLVQAKINEVQPELPAGITLNVQRLTPSVFPIISYNITGAPPATLLTSVDPNFVGVQAVDSVSAKVAVLARNVTANGDNYVIPTYSSTAFTTTPVCVTR